MLRQGTREVQEVTMSEEQKEFLQGAAYYYGCSVGVVCNCGAYLGRFIGRCIEYVLRIR